MSSPPKLLIASGAGALAVIALITHLIWSGYRDAIQAAQTTTRGYAAILEGRLDATLRRADAELQRLSGAIPVAALKRDAVAQNAQVPALMTAGLRNFPELSGFTVFDANGDLLYATNTATGGVNVADRRHFIDLRDNPGTTLTFSEAMVARTSNRPAVVFASAIRDAQGVFHGVVAALIDLEHFEKLFQSLPVGDGGVIAIYRSDRFTQVLRWPKGGNGLNTPLPADSPARAVAPGPDRTATFEMTSATDQRVQIYSRHALQAYPFFIGVGMARDEVLAGWRTRALVAALSTVLLLGLLLGLQFRRLRDITERKQAERMQAQLAAIVASSDDAIIGRAADDAIVSWNAAAERMFGWHTQEALGMPFRKLLSVDPDKPNERFDKVLRGENVPWFDETHARKDGSQVHVQTTLSAVRDPRGNILFVSCTMRDATERLKAARHIEQLATRDTLTGLFNRSTLTAEMDSAIVRAEAAATQLAVMFVDLDHFKEVNDTLGHAAGDELLRECARRIAECVRDADIVARLGGDEFVVLLTDVSDTALVAPVAKRMLTLLSTPYHVLGHDARVSASIGVCLYPADGRDVTALMKNADIAMYQAKAQGRNNYQFYAAEMNQRMMRRLQLEQELRSAVANNEFVLHYQPQVSFATGEILGAESLIRWRHPVRGMVPPAEFIPVAEETGLILAIGEWALNHACATIKKWRADHVNVPYIVVNISAAQLSAGLVDSVRQALVTHGIEAGWLTLEITETMLMERVEEAITILRRIRELGIRIAMDDFGTGYSSLSVLQRLPLDTLKIDRSFVSAIDDDANNARACAIIGAIIAIAKELDLNVVAEGVETPTQLAFLRTLNCDSYQGYLYSAPIDTITMEKRFAGPPKSVLVDEDGRAVSMTIKVNLELPLDTLS